MSKWSEVEHMSASAQAFAKAARAAEISVFVDQVIPKLRDTAKACGYALGLHGSLARDLDIIACPWTDRAISADDLIKRLADACKDATGWGYRSGGCTDKPHGRRAFTIIATSDVHLDISVMPLLGKQAEQD